MCLSRSSRRVENSCQQCSACFSSVFTAGGSRPSRPNLRRSSTVKAVPLVVNASNSLACPRSLSDMEKSSLSHGGLGLHFVRLLKAGRSSTQTVPDLLVPGSFDEPFGLVQHRFGLQVAVGVYLASSDCGHGGVHRLGVELGARERQLGVVE